MTVLTYILQSSPWRCAPRYIHARGHCIRSMYALVLPLWTSLFHQTW